MGSSNPRHNKVTHVAQTTWQGSLQVQVQVQVLVLVQQVLGR